MHFENQFDVDAPLERVWDAVLDVERVAPTVPGAQVLERTGDDAYKVAIKVKVGPMSMTYRGEVEITERDEVAHRAVMKARAKESRGQGTADADVTMHLTGDDDRTSATVTTDVALSGKVATMGQGVLQDVSGRLIDTFAKNLAAMLSGAEPAGAAAAARGRRRRGDRGTAATADGGPGRESGAAAPAGDSRAAAPAVGDATAAPAATAGRRPRPAAAPRASRLPPRRRSTSARSAVRSSPSGYRIRGGWVGCSLSSRSWPSCSAVARRAADPGGRLAPPRARRPSAPKRPRSARPRLRRRSRCAAPRPRRASRSAGRRSGSSRERRRRRAPSRDRAAPGRRQAGARSSRPPRRSR